MKVSRGWEGFRPAVITIILETTDEAEALYSVFSVATLCSFLEKHGIMTDLIRDSIGDKFDNDDVFNELIKLFK